MNQKELFEQTYIEISDAIFRYIFFRVFDRDIAKDLTQETFFKVWDYIAKGKEVENMKAFTYRTAHNLIVNSIRDKKPTLSIEELEETIGFDTPDENQAESKKESEQIAQVLESFKILKPDDIELMKLRYIDGLSIQEISEISQTSENSLSVKIHRLLQKLKEYNKES